MTGRNGDAKLAVIREKVEAGQRLSFDDGVYLYDHAARDLSRRLVENYHGHHDLSMATLHVHLDDDHCMEVTALKGTGAEVQHFADHIIAERGVRYGQLVMIPTEGAKKKGDIRKKSGHRHA